MKHINYHRGFTLVELILYGAILMSFLVVLTSLFSSLIQMQLSSESHSSLALDSRYLFSRLSYDIGRASGISFPISTASSSSVLQLTIDGSIHTYARSGNDLFVTNPLGSIQLNSFDTSVTDISFLRLGNSQGVQSLKINFTLSSLITREQGTENRSFETTFALR